MKMMMAMQMMHGFTPTQYLTRHECAIHKKQGNRKSEKMCIIHIVEATENQSLKISFAWKIKELVKLHTGILHEFQFGRPKSTCISAIILKTLSIGIIHTTKIPTVLRDIDAAKDFHLVINRVDLLALRSLGFPESLTTMINKLWSARWCHVKTAYGVSE
jgi:hypothetical protein